MPRPEHQAIGSLTSWQHGEYCGIVAQCDIESVSWERRQWAAG